MDIKQLVRKQILLMPDANWGEIPDNSGMRLLWGENQNILAIYRDAVENEINKVNLYPSPSKQKLKEEIAGYTNLNPENVVPTNGSDDAIELIAKVFIADGDEVIIPIPSFPCYMSSSQMMGATILTLPLETDFSLNVDKLVKLITPKTKIIWLANPNNPTGNLLLTKKQIEQIAKQVNCLFVVDECYFELCGITGATLIERYPNLIIIRSFSKVMALAGARLGYLLCARETATYLSRVQMNNQVFGINRFAQAAGIAILRQPEFIKNSLAAFQSLKKNFETKLAQLQELQVIETKTTFCLVKINAATTAAQLKEQLKEQNIFIKDCSIYQGFGKQYIYLGIPQEQYQQTVVDSIKSIVTEKKLC